MLKPSKQQIKGLFDTALRRIKAGQLEQAARDLNAILSVMPKAPEPHFHLAEIAHKLGHHADRARHLASATALRPHDVAFNEAAADAFTTLGDFDAALAAHDRLIAAAPKELKRRVDKGLALQFAGEFDAADKLFRTLIRKNPGTGALYRIFLTTAKIDADDPLMERMQQMAAEPDLADLDRMHVCFALAKALEGQGRTQEVFEPLHRANALQRALFPLDRPAVKAQNAALFAFQDGADLTPAGPQLPIRSVFVTGMPRSGTTLVEQILASHSQVTAGNEMPYASRLALNLFGGKSGMTPLASAPQRLIDDFARGYSQIVRQETGAASGVVTDKAIQSHRIYGLLHRALREVRFVVVHRDPRDIALSIYKNHFRTGTHRYANDLGDIAAEIKQFRANVAYWKARLPEGVLYEIRYEDLVAEPEPQTRALIAAAGLEWEETCLEFHKSRGAVKTLSLQQVRQPIYRGSAQAWRKYETELAPFIAAWGDEPWD